MSEQLVEQFVYEEAGFGCFDDGVYYVDFGTLVKLAEWDAVTDDPARYIDEVSDDE